MNERFLKYNEKKIKMSNKILLKIKNLVRKNNVKKADILFKRLLKTDQNNNSLKRFYLDTLFKEKKYKNVTAVFLSLFKDTVDEQILKIFSISLLELNKFQEAEIYFLKIIKINEIPENLSLLAICQSKLGKNEMAIENFKRAINIEPNNSRYIINLANHFRESNRTIQAINLLKDFNKSTTNINVLILLVGLLRDIQKHEEAIEYCSEAMKIEKENSYLILILATLFLESNNVVEAEKFFELSLKYRPFFGPALRMLSLFKKIDAQKLSDLEKFIENSKSFDPNLIQLGLAVSNFLEKNNNFKKSFKYLKRFNSYQKELTKYNINYYIEKFDKIRSIYRFYTRKKEYLNKEIKDICPIFIVGLPRSGTSLVEQILSSKKEIKSCGELTFLDDNFSKIFKSIKEEDISIRMLEMLSTTYIDNVVENLEVKEKFFTDKMPLNFFYVGIINLIYPSSKIILCKRSKMDNIISLYRNFFPSGNNFSYDLSDINDFLKLYDEVITYWKKERINFHIVDYESLIRDFKTETSTLFKYLNLNVDDSILEFHKNKRVVQTASFLQVRRPLFKSSIDSWKKYKDEIGYLNN